MGIWSFYGICWQKQKYRTSPALFFLPLIRTKQTHRGLPYKKSHYCTVYYIIKACIRFTSWKCSQFTIYTITVFNNHTYHKVTLHFSLNAPKLGLLFLGHYWCIGEDEIYSAWRICDSSRVRMYSFISYTEYAMSFTDFLLACLLWSNPSVMLFWTIPPCNIQQQKAGAAALKMLFTAASETLKLRWESILKLWVEETTIWSHCHQPLKDLNEMEMVWLWSPAGL